MSLDAFAAMSDHKETLKSDEQILKEMKKANKTFTVDDKARWLSELQLYGRKKGYQRGWALHAYRSKFGVWPRQIPDRISQVISQDVQGHITYLNIKRMKRAG